MHHYLWQGRGPANMAWAFARLACHPLVGAYEESSWAAGSVPSPSGGCLWSNFLQVAGLVYQFQLVTHWWWPLG